jgi:UDP-N-acetylmuramoyl-tripeptide--D-alanyl-D-alanine ligase
MFSLLNVFQVLAIFWLIRTTKNIFFYLYLWQLKEYHLGRFFDHFRTEKGKSLLFNKLNFLKIALLIYFFFLPDFLLFFPLWPFTLLSLYYLFPFLILLLYFFEDLKVFLDFLKKRVRLPLLTKKAIFLIFLTVIFEVGIIFTLFYLEKDLNFFAFWLLLFDLFVFLIVSAIVLIFQPLTVLLRNQVIKRAKKKREKFQDLLVVGITGSYGKTSTKEFLYTILSQKFNVLRTKEHQNSEIGISQCILNDLKPEREIFIVEMGAYNKGGIKLLCDIAKPKIGIVTGVNEQHLATFGSMENLLSAEGGKELIEALPEDGLSIFNGDNEYCLELYKKTEKRKKIVSSRSKPNGFSPDTWAEKIIVQKDYLFFQACSQEGCGNIKVYLSGIHFVPNLLAVICLAKELGMKNEEIAEACLKIESPKNTMKIFKGIKDLIIIDDSYSANPEGVRAALDYLKIYEGKKMIILPSLIELGKASKEIHRKIGEKIGEACDAAIITTKDYFQEIGEGFLRKGGKRENILFSDNPTEILEIIKKFWDPGDVVLLEGRLPNQLISSLIVSS